VFLFLGENHRASVQVVVTAYHFSRSGLDCLFQDRFRRAQALRDIFNIRFYGGFEIGTASRLHRGLDGGNDRIDVRRGLRLLVESFLRGLDCTATLVAQNDNKPGAKVLDRVLDTAEGVIVENVARHAHDK
jgi:hypothetical protein